MNFFKQSAEVAKLVAEGWKVTATDDTTGTVYLKLDQYEEFALRVKRLAVNVNGDVVY